MIGGFTTAPLPVPAGRKRPRRAPEPTKAPTPIGVRPRTPWLMSLSVVIVLGSAMLPATEPVVQIHSQTIVHLR